MREQDTPFEELRQFKNAVDELKKELCLSPIGDFLYRCLDIANALLMNTKK